MRKLHVIFIALLIPGGGIFSQSNISFLDEELISGNRTEHIVFDSRSNRPTFSQMATFDQQGNLREKRVFTYTGNETDVSVILPDNTISEKIKLIYNSMGYLIQEAYFDNKKTLLRKIEYTYDGNGQKTGEIRYHGS